MTNFELEIHANTILKKMLTDRGYIIDNDSKEEFSVKASKKDKQKEKDNHRMITFICKEDKLSIQGIKEFISIMNKENCNRCIIVYRDSVTSSAKKSLDIMEYNIELFKLSELQLDITKHRLVPKHKNVTDVEKELLDNEYKGKLPVLLLTDPICRYYQFHRGEYIRITRKDNTIIYRIVK